MGDGHDNNLGNELRETMESAMGLLGLVIVSFLPNVLRVAFTVVVTLARGLCVNYLLLLMMLIKLCVMVERVHSRGKVHVSLLGTDRRGSTGVIRLLDNVRTIEITGRRYGRVVQVGGMGRSLELGRVRRRVGVVFFSDLGGTGVVLKGLVVLLVNVCLMVSKAVDPNRVIAFGLLFGGMIVPLRGVRQFVSRTRRTDLEASSLERVVSRPLSGSCLASGSVVVAGGYYPRIVRIGGLSCKCGRGAVFHGMSVSLRGKGCCKIVNGANYNGSALLGLLVELVPIGSKGVVFLKRSVGAMSEGRLSGGVVFVPRAPCVFDTSVERGLLFNYRRKNSSRVL